MHASHIFILLYTGVFFKEKLNMFKNRFNFVNESQFNRFILCSISIFLNIRDFTSEINPSIELYF